MGALQRFEKRLEGLVEGAFAKVFKGVVHPVEMLNAMQREADSQKSPLPGGRFLVPNRYGILLSPADHARLAQVPVEQQGIWLQEQRSFLQKRDQCETDTNMYHCLWKVYDARVQQLYQATTH